MQCDKFEARMQKMLDERRAPRTDADLEAHAAICDDCRELLALQECLQVGIEQSQEPLPPAHFARRVVSAALVSQPAEIVPAHRHASNHGRRAQRGLGRQIAGVALVVALLLAVAPLVSWWSGGSDNPVTAVAVHATPQNVSDAGSSLAQNSSPTDNPHPVASPQAPGPAPAALAIDRQEMQGVKFSPEQIAQMARQADQLLTGRPAGAMVRNLSSRLTDVPVDESFEQIPALGPLATSFYTAIGVARRPAPTNQDEEPDSNRPANSRSSPPDSRPSTGAALDFLLEEVI
jgi:hypothetical protein